MRLLELKVPPLAIGVLMAALMWLVSWAVPALNFVIPGRQLLALIFALAGAIIIVFCVASWWPCSRENSGAELAATGLLIFRARSSS